MREKRKDIIWINIIIAFYILTGFLGVYDVTQLMMWPIFAVPMTLLLIKTGQKETIGLLGVMLSVIISFITTSAFHPTVISAFLLFILAPAFIFGSLYMKQTSIPRIVIATTITVFLNGIIFLTFMQLLGIDYLELYFAGLDTLQNVWNEYLTDPEVLKILPEGENILEVYAQVMAKMILQAKRTYPATLFITALTGSAVHLIIIQLIARIRSWKRPAMKEILAVGLSPVAAWVLLGLWVVSAQLGSGDSNMTFAIESMLVVLFTMFQVIGVISVIVMTLKLSAKTIIRTLLIGISIFWLIFNPTLLVIIGCLDSVFNPRKVKTLI